MTDGQQWQDRVLAGPGGAMTDEVGVITGPLTLRTTAAAGGLARFDVQYTDADEWYTLTGSPSPTTAPPRPCTPLPSPRSARATGPRLRAPPPPERRLGAAAGRRRGCGAAGNQASYSVRSMLWTCRR